MVKKYYVVPAMQEGLLLSRNNSVQNKIISLKDMVPGMCGIFPVFTNKKKALKYAGEKHEVITFQECKR